MANWNGQPAHCTGTAQHKRPERGCSLRQVSILSARLCPLRQRCRGRRPMAAGEGSGVSLCLADGGTLPKPVRAGAPGAGWRAPQSRCRPPARGRAPAASGEPGGRVCPTSSRGLCRRPCLRQARCPSRMRAPALGDQAARLRTRWKLTKWRSWVRPMMRRRLATMRRPGARMAPRSRIRAWHQERWTNSGAKARMIPAKRAARFGMAVSLGRNSASLPVTPASSPPLQPDRRHASFGQSRAQASEKQEAGGTEVEAADSGLPLPHRDQAALSGGAGCRSSGRPALAT